MHLLAPLLAYPVFNYNLVVEKFPPSGDELGCLKRQSWRVREQILMIYQRVDAVVNIDSFKKMNLSKAGHETTHLRMKILLKFHLVELDLTNLTKDVSWRESLETSVDKARRANFRPWIHVLCLRKTLGTNLEVF